MTPPKPTTVLVSACLLGTRCRYDGNDSHNPELAQQLEGATAVSVCPEQRGGLPTPRPRAWIEGGDGHDVLSGKARVVDETGADVTPLFLAGAHHALAEAVATDSRRAYLKARSPSCGVGQTYGTSNTLVTGDGVTAALLRREGITVEVVH